MSNGMPTSATAPHAIASRPTSSQRFEKSAFPKIPSATKIHGVRVVASRELSLSNWLHADPLFRCLTFPLVSLAPLVSALCALPTQGGQNTDYNRLRHHRSLIKLFRHDDDMANSAPNHIVAHSAAAVVFLSGRKRNRNSNLCFKVYSSVSDCATAGVPRYTPPSQCQATLQHPSQH